MISWIKDFFANWKIAYYEIDNWFFIKRTINKHKRTADWQKYNLRADWIGRIYTVINPQSPTDDGDTDEILRIKYAERLKPVNLYLDSLNLSESIYPSYEQIEGTRSYLFVYSPIFRVITFWRVFLLAGFITLFFASRLDSITWNSLVWAATKTWELISNIF